MTTYSAHAEPGQGLTLGHRVAIVKGWNPIVKRGETTVWRGSLTGSQSAAMTYAKAKAAEWRAYRQQHGEGLEEVAARKNAQASAERRRRDRMADKRTTTYELLQALASDAELVTEWLPKQALGRLAQVRELVAFVETDPPQSKAPA